MFTKQKGLSHNEAKEKLKQFGLNLLPEKPPQSNFVVFISQLKNPLVYVLLLAGIITMFIGHVPDSLIIFTAVILNTILGFIQEKKANNALYALKKFITLKAEVIRNGQRKKIDASQLVPGDLVLLSQGSRVPADGKIILANRLHLDEAILTGESLTVSKQPKDKIFMGTIVSAGQALMKIESTGSLTKIGTIADKIQETKEDTPLQKQLNKFSRYLVLLISTLVIIVFSTGILTNQNIADMFITSVALAVSSIPEGLLISLTVVLAIGMQKILKRRGLVRKLSSAETLGGITSICIDKTGTLTQGKMRVVDFTGNKQSLAQQAILANDLDDPLVIAIFEWGRGIIKNYIQKHPRLDSIPFTPKERFFASLNRWSDDQNIIFVNGAPDFLLNWCSLSEVEKENIRQSIDLFTTQGKRLIGFAKKSVDINKTSINSDDIKQDLEWVGLIALSDPVRLGVKEALKQVKDAGINIIVITGDYSKTSEFILSQLDMSVKPDEILLGEDVEKLSIKKLSSKLKRIKLFARTSPTQKLKIVEALQKNREVVAMMGDGVNDAPAIHKADVGIVVGEATDVAIESADLVLLDSNFTTVVAAIEEGRGMFDNIRKIILYLMCDAFAEIVVILGGIILGLPLPITAMQILWINLVSDGLPDLALTIDPKRKDIMKYKPHLAGEPLVNKWMIILIFIVSLVAGLLALLSFNIVYQATANVVTARTFTFMVLGLNSLTYVFSVRTLRTPFWQSNPFENKWLIVAVFCGFGLQVLPFINPSLRQFFGLSSLNFNYWITAIGLSVIMFIVIEIFKLLFLSDTQKDYKSKVPKPLIQSVLDS